MCVFYGCWCSNLAQPGTGRVSKVFKITQTSDVYSALDPICYTFLVFKKWVPARPQISSSKYVLVRQKNGTLKPLSVSNLPFHMILGPIFLNYPKNQ